MRDGPVGGRGGSADGNYNPATADSPRKQTRANRGGPFHGPGSRAAFARSDGPLRTPQHLRPTPVSLFTNRLMLSFPW